MSCCSAGMAFALETVRTEATIREELLLGSRLLDEHTRQTDLSVPDIHCGGCIRTIEKALGALPGVEQVRVNLSSKRVAVRWSVDGDPPTILETLKSLGYPAHHFDLAEEPKERGLSDLVRALAVAGFASSNIMLLSVAVWSGAEPVTRDLLHWISAMIALPAVAYSGLVFFRSAWKALRHGRTNMDVPISIGVLLTVAMSLFDTIRHDPHAYFDAATSLLFFLLVGRTLDHMMRDKARVTVKGLARLAAHGAMVLHPDGATEYLPIQEIEPGMIILLGVGERVPVDARVKEGRSDLDRSLVSGESEPEPVTAGSILAAGTLNLTRPLKISATAPASQSLLAELARLMEAAEGGRLAYRRISDRAAQLYAPIVHLAAFAALAGWMMATGDLYQAATIAVAVLIITCPCALGLAVPMVHVVAARCLFEAGIMMKDGGSLERLKDIDTVLFDKTGTLTAAHLQLADADEIDPRYLAVAVAMAAYSRHPHARALATAPSQNRSAPTIERIEEHPGLGIEAASGDVVYRLGHRNWAVRHGSLAEGDGSETVLSKNGHLVQVFRFGDRIRTGARQAVAKLEQQGLAMEVLSGDHRPQVQRLARELGLQQFSAGVLPGEKARRIAALSTVGRRVLMVGDGINDSPALAAAHASMAPGSAADISRNAADFVFLREDLEAVPLAIDVARRADRLIRQNFAMAVTYNIVAVPFAVLGYVTPLMAALTMSLSSIVVVGNALRLQRRRYLWPSRERVCNNAAPAPTVAPAQ